MKLELKHLAPYLPYGLKVFCENSTQTVLELVCLSKTTACLAYMSGNDYGFDFDKFKPILRPLTDLIKEIEINGEKFVPNNKLFDMYGQSLITNDYLQLVVPITCEPYILVRQLFEWHFDVFGLIKQGLAIDINTLPNEQL